MKFIELGEINEIRNEVKLEPESPDAQLSLSSYSPNHSESNDSDKQETRCLMQEESNYLTQNMDTEVFYILKNTKRIIKVIFWVILNNSIFFSSFL